MVREFCFFFFFFFKKTLENIGSQFLTYDERIKGLSDGSQCSDVRGHGESVHLPSVERVMLRPPPFLLLVQPVQLRCSVLFSCSVSYDTL